MANPSKRQRTSGSMAHKQPPTSHLMQLSPPQEQQSPQTHLSQATLREPAGPVTLPWRAHTSHPVRCATPEEQDPFGKYLPPLLLKEPADLGVSFSTPLSLHPGDPARPLSPDNLFPNRLKWSVPLSRKRTPRKTKPPPANRKGMLVWMTNKRELEMLASKEKTKNKSWPKELLDVESEEKAAEKDIVTDWEMREVGQYNRARSCTSAEDGASTPGDQVMEDYGYSGPQAIQTAAETVTEGMGKVSMGGASTI